jgi:YbbR domain-containing protein
MVRTQKVNIPVALTLVNRPDNLLITDINTSTLNITFQGKGADFIKFLVRPPTYELDLSSVRPGLNRMKLAADELVTTSPILLKSITPEYVEVRVSEINTKKISVIVPYRIEPQKGIYITSVIVQDTVTLLGPDNEIKFIDELNTDSIFITDYSSSEVSRKLAVIVPDVKIFKTRPESVTVIASIEKEAVRVYSEVSVKTIDLPTIQVNVEPASATITLRGAQSQILALADSMIKVAINTQKLEPGDYELPAEINLPKGIFLSKCDPKIFKVKIR